MSQIINIKAHEVLDSRGKPTVEVMVFTENTVGSAIVPSGASTGTHEALELRDKDQKRYLGKGVLKACNNVNTEIRSALLGMSVFDQEAIDRKMIQLDGTETKSRLGANALLGVSLACARAATNLNRITLFRSLNPNAKVIPTPLMNILNGGQHADSGLDIQEFMIVPVGAPNFREGLRMATEVFHTLGQMLHAKGYTTSVGDEGGYAPRLAHTEAALDFLIEGIEAAGFRVGKDFSFALDAAASEFYDSEKKTYQFKLDGKNQEMSSQQMNDYWVSLVSKYPIISLEDPLAEDDWSHWADLQERIGHKIQIVGDDLLVTNPQRLKKAIDEKAANAILIKLNQIGTLTETIETIQLAKTADFHTIISHRSGETEDTFIADLAVAMETGQIKTGSLCRGERIAKYNRLLRLEEELGAQAAYLGGRSIMKKN